MTKLIYLIVSVAVHITWISWRTINSFWHDKLQDIWENSSPEIIKPYIPDEYNLSKFLLNIFGILIILMHVIYIWKSKNTKKLKLIYMTCSVIISMVMIPVIFMVIFTISIEINK